MKKMDMKIVIVEWIDSAGCGRGWTNFQDKPTPEPAKMRSVGWLYHNGDDCIEIIPHYGEESKCAYEQGCGAMIIPKIAVVSITELIPTGTDIHVAGS